MLLHTLETLVQKSPNDCPFIVLRDFNINILDDSNHKNNKQQLIYFMNKLKQKSQFKNIPTKIGSQLDNIWSNVPKNESKSNVSKAYWLDFHKPIYMIFKLPDIPPIYSNKPTLSPFI